MAGSVRQDKVQIVLSITTNEAQAELQKLSRETSVATGKLKEMRKGTTEYVETSKQIREGTARMKELQDSIGITGLTMGQLEKMSRDLHKELKTVVPDSQEWTNISGKIQQVDGRLGNLKAQSKGVSAELLNMIPGFGAFDRGRTAISGAVGAAGKFSGAMNIVKVAIASTGIGLLVVALGALYAWFQKTDQGAKMIEGAFSAVGRALDVVIGRIDALLSGDFSGFFKGLGEEMAEAAKAGYDYVQSLDAIDDRRRNNEVANAKELVTLTKLMRQLQNKTLSDKERIQIALQAAEIEQRIHKRKVDTVQAELDLEKQLARQKIIEANHAFIETNKLQKASADALMVMVANGTLSGGTYAGDLEDKIRDLQKTIFELDAESVGVQEKIDNRRDLLLQQSDEKRKALQESRQKEFEKLEAKRKAEAEKAAADEIASLKRVKADEASVIKDEFDKKIALIENEREERLRVINESKATEETKARERISLSEKVANDLNQIEVERAEKITKKSEDEFNKLLEIANTKAKAIAEIEVISAENSKDEERILAAKISRINAIRQIEVEGTNVTEEQKKLAILKAEKEIADEREKFRKQNMDSIVNAAEDTLSVFSSLFSALQSVERGVNNRRLKELDNDKNKRIKILDEEKNKGTITQEQYEEQKAKIEADAQIKAETLRKDALEKQKVFSIFTVLTNLAIEISKYYAQFGVIGTGFALAASARALASVAAINAQEYEQGGTIELRGSRHKTAGRKTGILMTDLSDNKHLGIAEGGERMMIIRRNTPPQVEHYLDLAMLAQKGVIGKQFADGGVVIGREPLAPTANPRNEDAILAEMRALRVAVESWPDRLIVEVPINSIRSGLDKVAKIRAENSF